MKNDILVSVIVPVYNVEKYIKECLDSIVFQTYTNIEVILVDDGSTDNSSRICDDYAIEYKNFTVIHKHNGGLSEARNVGFESSNGKYVYFLDSDDYIKNNTIESLVAQAEHYSAEVVFFDAAIVDETDNVVYSKDAYIRKGLYSNPIEGVDMLKELLRNSDYVTSVPMLFIKRSILEDQLSFCNGIIYEDVLFTFSLFLKCEVVVHLAESLYFRRLRSNSIITKKKEIKNFKSIIRVYEETFRLREEYAFDQKRKKMVVEQLQLLFEVSMEIYWNLRFIDRVKSISLKHDLFKMANVISKKQAIIGYPKLLMRQYKALTKYIAFKPLLKEKTLKISRIINNKKVKSKFKMYIDPLMRESRKKRIIILGTPLHGNLGDHLIAEAEKQFFQFYEPEAEVIEIPMLSFVNYRRQLRKYIKNEDLLIVSGGGWLGTLWMHNEIAVRDMIKDYPRNKIIIFPQTLYYERNEKGNIEIENTRKIYSDHACLSLYLRDKDSYNFVKEHQFDKNMIECGYVPDIALFYDVDLPEVERNNVLMCFRQDREKTMTDEDRRLLKEFVWNKGLDTIYTTTVFLYGIDLDLRFDALLEKLIEYKSARIVITDRLHSMIIAALAGTPCIAINNKTGKVAGVYEWIKNLDYIKFVDNIDQAREHFDQLINLKNNVFSHEVFNNNYKGLVQELLRESN